MCLRVKLCVSHVRAHFTWVKQALTGIVPHTHFALTFIQCLNGILIKRRFAGTWSSECVCCNHSLFDQCHVMISLRCLLSLSGADRGASITKHSCVLPNSLSRLYYTQDTGSFWSIKADNHFKNTNNLSGMCVIVYKDMLACAYGFF